jgi:type IV secretion system protein VirB11
VEFLRPLRELLDAPGVTEACVNGPGQLFIEATDGWHIVPAPALTLERCLSLANAVATYCDQQINQERPLLSATLPTGERIQFAIPPAVSRDTVSITIRKPTQLIKRLDDFERERLFEHLTDRVGADRHSLLLELELLQLKTARRYADFLRLAVRRHQTIVVSGRTGSGKTTFMKGLIEEVPKDERLITIEDTAELTLPSHTNVVHLFYSKDGQGTARVTAKSLLEACLRMKPDRIFLAEVRGDECFHFVRLAASGHPGSITSVHAGSCALAFEQMALMIRESGAGGGRRAAHRVPLWRPGPPRARTHLILKETRHARDHPAHALHADPGAAGVLQLSDSWAGLPGTGAITAQRSSQGSQTAARTQARGARAALDGENAVIR